MKKSHEKSIIAYSGYFNMLADLTENGYVILQVEDLGEKRGYLCEYVGKDKYDRTTAEEPDRRKAAGQFGIRE